MKHEPYIIRSTHNRETKINDLEGFFLIVQELIQDRVSKGKKGKKLPSGYKMSYVKAQGILFDLHTYFGLKGCFTFGPCETCDKFNSKGYSHESLGKCKGKEKNWCDSCDEHS